MSSLDRFSETKPGAETNLGQLLLLTGNSPSVSPLGLKPPPSTSTKIGFETATGRSCRVLGAHDRAELRLLADGRHDHVGVALEAERDLLVELHRRVREPLGRGLAREVERLGRAAVQEDLDAVHVEPVRALDPDLERRRAAGAARSSPGIASAPEPPARAELDLQERAVRHDQIAALGGVDDVERLDLGRVVGRALHVVPQPARAVEVVVGVGVDHAGDAPALVQELEPVDDRVVVGLARRARSSARRRSCAGGWTSMTSMLPSMPAKPASGMPSPLRSRNIQPMSGWLTWTSFSLPPSQRASRSIWISGSSSAVGAAVVLGVGPQDQREGILVVQRQRAAGQLDPDARGHPPLGPQALQVRVVGREAVVLGAGGEFDVLAEQVQHPAELARGVVARGAGMAVEVGADPAVGLHRADQLRLQERLLARARRRPA